MAKRFYGVYGFLAALSVSLSFFSSSLLQAAPPLNPWPEEEVHRKLEELQAKKEYLEELLDSNKIELLTVQQFLNSDPYLYRLSTAAGVSKYKLYAPERFEEGEGLVISLALRRKETASGPLAKEVKQNLRDYWAIVDNTIKHYEHVRRKLDKERAVKARYPAGLRVYEKPQARNSVLAAIYDQLFRDADQLAAGTAGVLLHEVRKDLELKHLEKARDRISNLRDCIKEQNLSRIDAETARLVLKDLETAVQEAEYSLMTHEEDGYEEIAPPDYPDSAAA